jgi:hypothetical protein
LPAAAGCHGDYILNASLPKPDLGTAFAQHTPMMQQRLSFVFINQIHQLQ